MGFFELLVQVGVAVGPALVYLDQVRNIVKKRSSQGFSKDVTAVILFACIARIWFRVHEVYALALLIQAILLIVVQLVLLELLLRFRPGSYASAAFTASSDDYQPGSAGAHTPTFKVVVDPPAGESSSSASQGATASTSQDLGGTEAMWQNRPWNFWLWDDFPTYCYWLAGYTAILGVFVLLLGRFSFFNWLLGFYALGLEALLPLPQALSNYRNQSLAGLSPVLVAAWVGGDLAKTAYFIWQKSPPQFLLCALIQLSIDVTICYQAYLYRDKTAADEAALAEQASKVKAAAQARKRAVAASSNGEQDVEADAEAELETRPGGAGHERVEADDDDAGEASPFRIV